MSAVKICWDCKWFLGQSYDCRWQNRNIAGERNLVTGTVSLPLNPSAFKMRYRGACGEDGLFYEPRVEPQPRIPLWRRVLRAIRVLP